MFCKRIVCRWLMDFYGMLAPMGPDNVQRLTLIFQFNINLFAHRKVVTGIAISTQNIQLSIIHSLEHSQMIPSIAMYHKQFN